MISGSPVTLHQFLSDIIHYFDISCVAQKYAPMLIHTVAADVKALNGIGGLIDRSASHRIRIVFF